MPSDVNIREHPLPGPGRLYELLLPEGTSISVAIDPRTGARSLSTLAHGEDEPALQVELDAPHAAALAALLSGLELQASPTPPSAPKDGVVVETIVIGAASPAVGHLVHDLTLPDPEGARILAVIRDDTPEILEDDERRPCHPGDRLILAGRPTALVQLQAHLAG